MHEAHFAQPFIFYMSVKVEKISTQSSFLMVPVQGNILGAREILKIHCASLMNFPINRGEENMKILMK